MVLKILQNSHESTCARVFLNKVAGHVFSCEFWEISKNNFSYKTPPVAASETRPWIRRTFFENVPQEKLDCET